jgi:hypothetical protein
LVNSYVGGGIIDCLNLAACSQAPYLFVVMNDVKLRSRIDIASFENLMTQDRDLVQIAASVTSETDKSSIYPWMVHQEPRSVRIVPHSDILCCLLRRNFIDSFGGFPLSRSGWGYDLELSYQAFLQRKKIAICDEALIEHDGDRQNTLRTLVNWNEMRQVYQPRYGDFIAALRTVIPTHYARWRR